LKTHIHKILIAISLLITFISCDFTSAEEYYNEAIKLTRKGKWKEASVFLDKAIEKKPTFKLALIKRGREKAIWLDDYEGGIEDLNKALTIDPNNTLALYYIGYIHGDQQKHKKAIEYQLKALKSKSIKQKPSVKENLYDDYESLYTVDESTIHYELGLQYVRIEEFDKAIENLHKTVAAKSHLQDAYFLLGEAYIGKKDTISACPNFMKSAKLGDQEAQKMLQTYCK
jgi:tetratricopeptide (TPR) repeat protein